MVPNVAGSVPLHQFTHIAFDADDTLWHNEHLFQNTHEAFAAMLARYHDAAWVRSKLYATERKNLPHYGYGVKAFGLSLLETAVELTEGRITGQDVATILGWVQTMIQAPVERIAGVTDVLEALFPHARLMVITKGDLLDQQNKVQRSGLAAYFAHVEVVSEKDEDTYAHILQRHGIAPAQFLMIGNSVRSDILPVLALGAHAAHVPCALLWEHEVAAMPAADTPGFYPLQRITDLLGGGH